MEQKNGKHTARTTKRRRARRTVRPGCMMSVVILIMSFAVLFLTPIFNVEKIEVVGNRHLTSEAITEKSGLKTGDNLFRSNVGKAKKNLKKTEYIENVKVKRVLPDKIKIVVEEGTVAAYLEQNDSYVGISSNGKTLCSVDKASFEKNEGVYYKAPTVKGISVKKSEMGKAVEVNEKVKFETLLAFLKTFEEKGMSGDVTEFDISRGSFAVFKYKDKLTVNFGDMTKYEYKFKSMLAFLEETEFEAEGELNLFSDVMSYGNVEKTQ